MTVTAVIGSQWGDEGKGKVVDFLAESVDYVARFNGGNNAGHTVINEFGTFKIHLVPSGIFAKNVVGLIGGGVVIDPQVLIDEIQMLNKAGIKVDGRLWISPRSHVIMPYHKNFGWTVRRSQRRRRNRDNPARHRTGVRR